MSPRVRRVVQALLYETFAIALVAPTLSLIFGHPPGSTFMLTLLLSSVALGWNFAFNAAFERWESRQQVGGRSWRRRAAHGLGFEGGMALLLVPIMAWWLQITLLEALIADLGLMLFFLVYTVVFTWSFDRVFGLPQSAVRAGGAG